jgi:uncharacterized spore protein YtfJ
VEHLEPGPGVVDRIIGRLAPMLSADRVFGAPVERDGVTVIPVASFRTGGGGGGGEGGDGANSGSGEGGGFGAIAKPAGAYVIKGGDVAWEPAVDVNRIVSTAGTIVMVLLFVRWRVIRARLRAA